MEVIRRAQPAPPAEAAPHQTVARALDQFHASEEQAEAAPMLGPNSREVAELKRKVAELEDHAARTGERVCDLIMRVGALEEPKRNRS